MTNRMARLITEDTMKTQRTIYARKISGDLFDVTTSYDSTLDRLHWSEIARMANDDRATIKMDDSQHRQG